MVWMRDRMRMTSPSHITTVVRWFGALLRPLTPLAKSMGYQVWVLVFNATLNNIVKNCASSADMASQSANAAQLNAKFVEICKNIGSLRLSR